MVRKMKKRLTHFEEFEILKMVMDKFLWVAFIVTGIGFYNVSVYGLERPIQGIGFILSGMLLFGIFTMILIREYEIMK